MTGVQSLSSALAQIARKDSDEARRCGSELQAVSSLLRDILHECVSAELTICEWGEGWDGYEVLERTTEARLKALICDFDVLIDASHGGAG